MANCSSLLRESQSSKSHSWIILIDFRRILSNLVVYLDKYDDFTKMIEMNFLYDKFEDDQDNMLPNQPDLLELKYQENFVLKIINRFVNARSAVK